MHNEYSSSGHSSSGHFILVVDDDPDMCWVLKKVLTLAGYMVTVVGNGADALACLQQQPFTLALLDIKLPTMDGLQLAAELQIVAPTLAVILISGYYYAEDPEIESYLQKKHDAGFIAKPFSVAEVRDTVQRVLWQKNKDTM